MLKGDIVLTATERLAPHLQQTKPNAEVLSLHRWLERLWGQYHPSDQLLLNETQVQALWKNPLAKKAWQLLNQWELALDILKNEPAQEIQFFYRAAKAYTKKCQDNGWVDHSQLPHLLGQVLHKPLFDVAIDLPGADLPGAIHLPEQIFLAGFDTLTPAIQTFFDRLQSHHKIGVKLMPPIVKALPNAVLKLGVANQEQEIRSAALWAKAQLNRNPEAQIACVVPNLSQIRHAVMQIFTEILSPESLLPHQYNNKSLFNISMGQPFSDFPIIDTALLALALDPIINPIPSISRLLYSPFIAHTESIIALAMLDAELSRHFETHVFMSALPENFIQSASIAGAAPSMQTPSAYAKQFTQQLQQLGWPGARTLNSDEYQTLQRWQVMLEEFSSLDAIIPTMNHHQALDYLTEITKRSIYQTKQEDCRIHILGSLEAAGLSFDDMWVMGMDSNSWPAPANPNPFLPIRLQKQCSMPQASAKQQLDFTRKLTQRLQQENTRIIFSYAKQGDDQELLPSPLLHDIKEISFADLAIVADLSYTQQIYQSRKIETITDNHGPKIQENEHIRGGSKIVKEQAACPFKAFAELRLHAKEINTGQPGLHPTQRGQILHAVLERLWQKLDNHHQLCTLEQKRIEHIIFTSIDAVLNHFRQYKPYTFKKHFMAIERERLFYLLKKWLAVEKTRHPFKVIAKESRLQTKLNALNVHLQIDRIDELEDGSKIIIDYKTGKSSVNDWFGDRPNEPQLPLYCITHPSPIDGILFAQIRSQSMYFSGITKNAAQNFSGMKNSRYQKEINSDNWQTLQKQWKTIFLQLEKDFCQGLALVDPKNQQQTCTKCTLQNFCRIAEKSL